MKTQIFLKNILLICAFLGVNFPAYSIESSLLKTTFETSSLKKTVELNIMKFENEHLKKGKSLFLVPGFVHNAKVFIPLAEAILKDQIMGKKISRVYALDIIGHGESQMPKFKWSEYSMMSIVNGTDQALAIDAALKHVKKVDGNIDIISGHSMGALLIQYLAKLKQDEGSDLQRSYGAQAVMLIASALPQPIDWDYQWKIVFKLLPHIKPSLSNGAYIELDPETYINFFFTPRNGSIINTPTSDEIDCFKSKESLPTGLRVGGFLFPRFKIPQDIFNNTVLASVSFENDLLMLPEEEKELHTYLGGSSDGYFNILGDEAVHNAMYTIPETLFESLNYILGETRKKTY